MTDDEKQQAADGAETLCGALIAILGAHGADGVALVLLGAYLYGLAEGGAAAHEHCGSTSEDGKDLVALMPILRERGRAKQLEFSAKRSAKGDA